MHALGTSWPPLHVILLHSFIVLIHSSPYLPFVSLDIPILLSAILLYPFIHLSLSFSSSNPSSFHSISIHQSLSPCSSSPSSMIMFLYPILILIYLHPFIHHPFHPISNPFSSYPSSFSSNNPSSFYLSTMST